MIESNTSRSLPFPNKQGTRHDGNISTLGNHEVGFDPTRERVWWKMDAFVLPVLSIFQSLSFLDQNNIGNARVAGLQEDLMLSDHQFTVALTVTYAAFIVTEIPANLLLRVVGPNRMLPAMVTLWGIVATFQGFVRRYSDLVACRFLLGLFEGAGASCMTLYLSFWYPRRQLQWRISFYRVLSSLTGAFSGLLAYGIIRMDGLGRRPGWAWIFILEGLFSILFGISTFFTLPHSPARAPFLNDAEKRYVISRLRESGAIARDDKSDAFSWWQVRQALTLPHVWMLSLIFFFTGAIQFGLSSFTPSIVAGLGYTPAQAQLYSVPPIAVGFFVTMVSTFLSDRFGARGLNIVFSSALMIIGFAMFLVSGSLQMKYGSLFLIVAGSQSGFPALLAWTANNVAPYNRRATAVAIGPLMMSSGAILSTWLLGSLSPPPLYRAATITLLAFSVFTSIIAGINIAYLNSQNKRKLTIRATIAYENEPPGLGDRSAWFMYCL